MTWPAAVFWLAIVVGAANSGSSLLLPVFTAAASFGSLQMIPANLSGGFNVLPQSVVAAALVGVIIVRPGNPVRALASALDPRRMGLLVAFGLYGLIGAILLPRVFRGQVDVIPMTAEPSSVPLYPTSSNVAQAAYMLLSIGTALALSLVAAGPGFKPLFLRAVLVGGITVIVTGLADLALSSVGLGTLLEPFRTVTYKLLTDAEVLGARRVVGLVPEASVYGTICVNAAAMLLFLRPCFGPALRPVAIPLLVVVLMIMAVLSTASTAYVGLAVLVACYGLFWLRRVTASKALAREILRGEMIAILGGLFVLFALMVLSPAVLDPYVASINAAVFQKTDTSSFIERSMWNRVGFGAFVSTHGLGVGLGGVRTSNWLISILGSTGAIGFGLLAAFCLRLFLPSLRGSDQSVETVEFRRGLRFSLIPALAMATLSGTTPDIGLFNASIFGVLIGLAEPSRHGPATERVAQRLARARS